MKCRQMGLSTLSLGNGPYQGVAGSQWSSVDSRLVMPGPRVVDRVQSRQPWVILWDCLDSFHGKLDEGSSTRAEGSGDVTAFAGLCLDSTGLHRTEQTIQLKAVPVKELRKRKINKSCTLLCPGALLDVGGCEEGGEQFRADFTASCFD